MAIALVFATAVFTAGCSKEDQDSIKNTVQEAVNNNYTINEGASLSVLLTDAVYKSIKEKNIKATSYWYDTEGFMYGETAENEIIMKKSEDGKSEILQFINKRDEGIQETWRITLDEEQDRLGTCLFNLDRNLDQSDKEWYLKRVCSSTHIALLNYIDGLAEPNSIGYAQRGDVVILKLGSSQSIGETFILKKIKLSG